MAAEAARADALDQSVHGSFANAVKASAPAVVSIYTRSVENEAPSLEQMLGDPARRSDQDKSGSGVIVDGPGNIVTNNHVTSSHVTSRSLQIYVQLADGRTAAARLVGSDPDTDLAVLQIDLPRLPVMQLGRSDRVAVGDVVLAIGNPFGKLAQTVTHGIVSATGRADLGVATYEDFIQTDARDQRRQLRWCLVNARGELIGHQHCGAGQEGGSGRTGHCHTGGPVRGVMREIPATRARHPRLGSASFPVTYPRWRRDLPVCRMPASRSTCIANHPRRRQACGSET